MASKEGRNMRDIDLSQTIKSFSESTTDRVIEADAVDVSGGSKSAKEPGGDGKTEITMLAQYVKNVTLDIPNAPQVFKDIFLATSTADNAQNQQGPKIDVSFDLQVHDMRDDDYEVTLSFKIKSQKDLETLFKVDIEYSGIVKIKEAVSEEVKKQILLVYCPNLLFPFVRTFIANTTRESGFQPVLLNPIDFATLYAKHQEQERANQQVH